MRLLSIQVGKPKTISVRGKDLTTGIFKDPVPGPVMVRTLNLDGDGQADLRVHGGRDKAVYAYANDVYPEWKKLRPQDDFPPGAMGENLSLDTLPENRILIGDTFELGGCVLQVTQPRFPCHKLAAKFNDPEILKQFVALGRPGVYFRVLKEGMIDRGQSLTRIDREAIAVSVQELFELDRSDDPARLREILKLKSLNESWRARIDSWLS